MIFGRLKKSAAFLTAAAIFFTAALYNTNNVQAAEDTVSWQSEDILSRLSITPAESDSKVSRYDFAVMIMKAVNKYDECTDISESVFEDVEGIAVSVLNTAAEYGYFKVPADKRFRPYETITYAEAAAVAVRIIGFEYKVKDGANLTQYVNVARGSDVLKGVNAADFRGRDVNRLIFNMLTADCADTVFLENGTELKTEKESLLEVIFGISRYQGTVSAISGTAVLGNNAESKSIAVIDGNEYITDEVYKAAEYLGAEVDYYVTEYGGQERLFAMYRRRGGEITVLSGSDVDYVAPDFSYIRYNDGNNSKTIRIASDATVIYNNSGRFSVPADEFFKDSVRITLTDGNNDNYTDTVSVESPRYYRVASVNQSDMRIDDENGLEAIITDDFKEDLVTVSFEDGTVASLDDVKTDCMLEVLCSETENGRIDYSKAVKFIILRKTVSGQIEGVDTGDKVVTVDGTEYRYISDVADKMKMGKSRTFYMGSNGKLVYSDPVDDDGKMYGYLIRIAKKSELSSSVEMKIFTQESKMTIYETGNKIKFTGYIDGKYTEDRTIDSKELPTLVSGGQLIRFSTDEKGLIKSLALAYDHSSEVGYDGYDDDRFSLEYQSSRGQLFNVVASENYFYNTDSIIFGIPDSGEDEDYVAEKYSYYSDTKNINVKLYDADKSYAVAAGVAYISDSMMPELSYDEEGDTYAALIAAKYYTRDSDGDMVTAFKAYCRGTEVKLTASDEKLADNNVSVPNQGEKQKILFTELNPGDVIQYKTNSKGEVNLINVLNRFDGENPVERQFYNGSDGYLCNLITAFGSAGFCKPGGYISLAADASRRYSLADKRMASYIYLYDINKQTVEVLSSLPYVNTDSDEKADYVFVKTRRTSVRDMVIYRR